MTDNSTAEKSALLEIWPEAPQLLCHFHVAQAEWRWLTAAHNKVSNEQRRKLMSAFQKVSLGNFCTLFYSGMAHFPDLMKQ